MQFHNIFTRTRTELVLCEAANFKGGRMVFKTLTTRLVFKTHFLDLRKSVMYARNVNFYGCISVACPIILRRDSQTKDFT